MEGVPSWGDSKRNTDGIRLHGGSSADPASRAGEAGDECLRAVAAETVTLIPDDEFFPAARTLALPLRHPSQDCLYLACAQRLRVPLPIAEPKFHRRAAATFPDVQMLARV